MGGQGKEICEEIPMRAGVPYKNGKIVKLYEIEARTRKNDLTLTPPDRDWETKL